MENSIEKLQPLKLYKFKDGLFTFWETHLGNQIIVFRVREDVEPAKRALEKGIPRGEPTYKTSEENINEWLKGHPDYELIEE